MGKQSFKGEQLGAQKEDYELAFNNGELFLCECGALTISTAEDVDKGECFYCGSKKIIWDKAKVKAILDKRIKEGVI
jgi:hypothetical protein